MFEEMTQEKILEEALGKAQELEVSSGPGSLVYNSSVLMATMLEDAFDKSEEIYLNAFPDTCDREHLIRFARAKGLTPKAATAAEYEIKCNVQLEIGCRLTANNVSFEVTAQGETDADGKYLHTVCCLDIGAVGDKMSGELDLIDEAAGFESAEFVKQAKMSAEDEDTEVFRERFFETYALPGQFGNKKFYHDSAMAFEGVGAVKVAAGMPAGAVVLTIVDNEGKSAGTELCTKLQSEIQKPICHTLTVSGAQTQGLDFSVSVSTEGGLTEADAIAAVKKIIADYIKEINLKGWESGTLKVRLPIIQMRIFEVDNITDCEIEPIGGKYTVEIADGKIAGIGAVNVTVT